MTKYSELQERLLRYRHAERQYQERLIGEVSHFRSDLIRYLEIESIEFQNIETNTSGIVFFRDLCDGTLKERGPSEFIKDGANQGRQESLLFAVNISILDLDDSSYNISKDFKCSLHKKSESFYVTLINGDNYSDILCQRRNNEVDFTPVFDEIFNRLMESIDPTIF
ncbi:hypothetical protein [Xenorhabdus bovienii]|uniref:hypothetical protein n=1 Tax=Xenorhabdus bovienii TaxID=40576 RepID=UPI002157E575|nr:hypothetical protein [Xenorhabdus bovienii]